MILYNPIDGFTVPNPPTGKPKHCFLMTRLGNPIPSMVQEMRLSIESVCLGYGYEVIDATTRVTGRDFLLKIWSLIASVPLSVGIVHEDIQRSTQANIFYELGIAQALGKETIIIKSPAAEIPSDFVRTEHITFDGEFSRGFKRYLDSIVEQADYYETMADQLENDPILSLDYLKRAFLINGKEQLRDKAKKIVDVAGIEGRAKSSVERLAASF